MRKKYVFKDLDASDIAQILAHSKIEEYSRAYQPFTNTLIITMEGVIPGEILARYAHGLREIKTIKENV